MTSEAAANRVTGQIDSQSVHLWCVSLELPNEIWQGLRSILDSTERTRADRYLFEKHRRRFTVARAALRSVLADYLDCAAQDVSFEYEAQGKPRLNPTMHASGLRFNISHSADQAIIALTANRDLGVDVERIRPMENYRSLAERYFSEFEATELLRLPDEVQLASFFWTWTRKEAYLKARGTGLTERLRNFDVECRPGHPCCLLATRPDADEVHRWRLGHVEIDHEYVGALVTEGEIGTVVRFEWSADLG
jgi:4'-phosphopantetheinyl transferase